MSAGAPHNGGNTPASGPLSLALSAALWTALIVVVAASAYQALDAARRHAHRMSTAAALADRMAQAAGTTAAGRDDLDKAADTVEKQNAPLVAFAFATSSGGVDEFGIARGSGFSRGEDKAGPAAAAVMNHAKSLVAVAQRALSRGEQVPWGRLVTQLEDGRIAVAMPYRKGPDDQAPLGVAGVVLKPAPMGQRSPTWLWALCLLVPLLVLGLARGARLPPMVAGMVGTLVAAAAVIAFAPPLMPGPEGGVQILGGQHLIPHEGATMSAALGSAHLWLAGVLLSLAVIGGLLTGPLAGLLAAVRRDPVPYLYVGPAVLATGVLIFVPFAVGVGLGFTYRGDEFVGVDNYIEVLKLAAGDYGATHFFRTLLHTVIWTVLNVFLHVTIGLGLALVLNRPNLMGRRFYRMLLIIPWAVPNYITALTWKWMFNTQYGPINAMMGALGFGQVDWLGQSPFANFAANLITNVWLGFPFMMVISLGALQSIPAELYEAASIDGASGWQKFKNITLPLLRPALFPAIILGTIWTFNAFNIIYLVSGGGPDHQTEILITEAYYIFTVLQRTGLAAAYSVIIFLLLLIYTLVTNRLTSATESVD